MCVCDSVTHPHLIFWMKKMKKFVTLVFLQPQVMKQKKRLNCPPRFVHTDRDVYSAACPSSLDTLYYNLPTDAHINYSISKSENFEKRPQATEGALCRTGRDREASTSLLGAV